MGEKIKITVLGCGTSTGVPLIACPCSVCHDSNPRNKRYRTSILITDSRGRHIVVDTPPEFRLQMIRENVEQLEHVLLTHLHADHCHGIDDLRSFFFRQKTFVTCYLGGEHEKEFRSRFSYIVEETSYEGIKPQIKVKLLDRIERVLNFDVESVVVPHGKTTSRALRIGSFAYATDFHHFPPELIAAWKGTIHTMIASGVYFGTHPTHSTIETTCELFRNLGVKRGIITHLSHEVEYERDSKRLPAGVELAYDGMKIEVDLSLG